MKPRVYLETSVVSYLVGRLSRDVVVLGNQELTREWWGTKRDDYEFFISEVVIGEVAIGDPQLAQERMEICAGLPLLSVTEEAEQLAPLLRKAAALAPNAETDTLHMAIAAVHGLDYRYRGTARTSRTQRFVAPSSINVVYPVTSHRSSARRRS